MTRRPSSLPENYLEVRCCCDPSLVLGYLPGPVSPAAGVRVKFMGPDRLELEVARVAEDRVELDEGGQERVDRWTALAYKSDETPVEVLRRVPGFVEPR